MRTYIFLIGFLLLFVTSDVFAGFQYVQKKQVEPKNTATSDVKKLNFEKFDFGVGQAIQIGSGVVEKKSSFGSSIRLSEAINIVKPEEWNVIYGEKDLKDVRVSWKAKNEPWVETLDRFNFNEGAIVVYWPEKNIYKAKTGKNLSDMLAKKKYVQDKSLVVVKSKEYAQNEKKNNERESGNPAVKDKSKNIDREDNNKQHELEVDKGKQVKSVAKNEFKEKSSARTENSQEKKLKASKETTKAQIREEKKNVKIKKLSGPIVFGPGELKKVMKDWADKWGYDVVMDGIDEIDLLAISHPLKIKGEEFLDDLHMIAHDLNKGSSFNFKFDVYKKNRVVDIKVSYK